MISDEKAGFAMALVKVEEGTAQRLGRVAEATIGALPWAVKASRSTAMSLLPFPTSYSTCALILVFQTKFGLHRGDVFSEQQNPFKLLLCLKQNSLAKDILKLKSLA